MKDPHSPPKTHMDVSENSGTPKSSILIGFSIINQPFWGTTIFGNTRIASKKEGAWEVTFLLRAKAVNFGHGKTGEIALTVMELQGMNHFAKNKPDFPRWKKNRNLSAVVFQRPSLALNRWGWYPIWLNRVRLLARKQEKRVAANGEHKVRSIPGRVLEIIFLSIQKSEQLHFFGGNCRKCVLRYSHLTLVSLSGQNVEKWEKKIRQD